MSVIVTVVIPADVEQFTSWVASDIENITAISQKGKEAGAIHHRFAIGEGSILVLDEWTSAEAFNEFFASPEIAEAMANGGPCAPTVTIYEAMETADQF